MDFLLFSPFSRPLKFPNISGNNIVPFWNFSEHFGTNFTPPEQFSLFFFLVKNDLKIQSKSMCFTGKLFLLRYWPKTAQARIFHSKITRRTITIRFPAHSLEPTQCFKKLQRGHRWRRKVSKCRTSREVTWGLPKLWNMKFEISAEIWRKRPRLGYFTLKSFLRVVRSQFVLVPVFFFKKIKSVPIFRKWKMCCWMFKVVASEILNHPLLALRNGRWSCNHV